MLAKVIRFPLHAGIAKHLYVDYLIFSSQLLWQRSTAAHCCFKVRKQFVKATICKLLLSVGSLMKHFVVTISFHSHTIPGSCY